jgi:hypothetical protein
LPNCGRRRRIAIASARNDWNRACVMIAVSVET